MLYSFLSGAGFITILGGIIGAFSGAYFSQKNLNKKEENYNKRTIQRVFLIMCKHYEEILSIEKKIQEISSKYRIEQLAIPSSEYRVSLDDIMSLNLLGDKEIICLIWDLFRFPRRFTELLHRINDYNDEITMLRAKYGESPSQEDMLKIRNQLLSFINKINDMIKQTKEALPYDKLFTYFKINFPSMAGTLVVPDEE